MSSSTLLEFRGTARVFPGRWLSSLTNGGLGVPPKESTTLLCKEKPAEAQGWVMVLDSTDLPGLSG